MSLSTGLWVFLPPLLPTRLMCLRSPGDQMSGEDLDDDDDDNNDDDNSNDEDDDVGTQNQFNHSHVFF